MPRKPFSLSVKIIILDKDGRCLLLKRSMRSEGNPGKWDLPGGKVDPGESFEEALLREVCEETGLSVFPERVLAAAESEKPSARVAYLIMEGRPNSTEVRLRKDEHEAYAWIDRRDLADIDVAQQFRSFLRTYSQIEE